MVDKQVIGRYFFGSLVSSDLGSRYVIPVVSQPGIFLGSSISMLKVFVM
jgi:hypothetical protein